MIANKSQLSSPHHHVCTWWIAYTFDNPFRKIFHNPATILGDYVKEGMTVLDVGCGLGYFSIGMAKLVGANGKVIAVDLQQKMLDIMLKRAGRAGVADRIIPHRCKADTIGIEDSVDFILAFWMVHEVSDQSHFFKQAQSILSDQGKLLIAEPKMHVSAKALSKIVEIAQDKGLRYCERPDIKFSRTALFQNSQN
jgi:ubiquinone/menaquinone biosynthesis C-methylase UbiE